MVLAPEHRSSMRKQAQPYRSRSLSPGVPYLWPDVDRETVDRKSRKGWYRVDYGPSKSEQLWYLPSFRDRMNFLERHVERATSEPRTRAHSVPPPTVTVRRTRGTSVEPIQSDPIHWRSYYWPDSLTYYYRKPYTTYYDWYYPTTYSNRIRRLPWYRYHSSPLRVWAYSRSYPPPPRYMPRYYPSYYDYDYGYGGYYGGYYPSMYPRISRYDYLDDYLDSPYLATSYRPRAIDVDTDKSTSIAVGKPSRVVTTTRTYSPGVSDTDDRTRYSVYTYYPSSTLTAFS